MSVYRGLDTRMYGSASMSGSARMSGSASMYDSARMYGSASMSGSARITDHMCLDRPDGYVCHQPIGSENRSATAAWDYKRREICVRAGCWYGSLEELEERVAPSGGHGWTGENVERWRTQYQCLIAAASLIPKPDVWPTTNEVQP